MAGQLLGVSSPLQGSKRRMGQNQVGRSCAHNLALGGDRGALGEGEGRGIEQVIRLLQTIPLALLGTQ